jgi:phage shock protein PspC (stress-responsive transcriptional regulator)
MNTTDAHPESHIEAETAGDSGHGDQTGSQSGTGAAGGTGSAWSTQHGGSGLPDLRTLRRPTGDRMLAGVASGIARYLDVDVNLVRIAFVVLAFVSGGAALPLYVAGWLLIPEEGAAQSIAGDLFSSFETRRR